MQFILNFDCYRSICIIGNGASRRRTRNACFRDRRADHSTTFAPLNSLVIIDYTWKSNMYQFTTSI